MIDVPDAPDAWTDGSLVQDQVSSASSSGSGFYAFLPRMGWDNRRWRHLGDIRSDVGVVQSCRVSALFWDPSNLLKALDVGRVLDGDRNPCLVEVWKDGDPRLRAMPMRIWFRLGGFGIFTGLILAAESWILLLLVLGVTFLVSVDVGILLLRFCIVSLLPSLWRWSTMLDGEGTARDHLIWSDGALPKKRRLVHAVRDHAMLPGLASLWTSECD